MLRCLKKPATPPDSQPWAFQIYSLRNTKRDINIFLIARSVIGGKLNTTIASASATCSLFKAGACPISTIEFQLWKQQLRCRKCWYLLNFGYPNQDCQVPQKTRFSITGFYGLRTWNYGVPTGYARVHKNLVFQILWVLFGFCSAFVWFFSGFYGVHTGFTRVVSWHHRKFSSNLNKSWKKRF